MSEETQVTEQEQQRMQDVAAEAAEETVQPEQQRLALEDMKVGYVVGLTDDGNFVFDLFGKEKGLVEILGLHQHATSRVETLYNQTQMSGDALVNEVGKAMSILNNKIDQILQVVAPKKPDNNL